MSAAKITQVVVENRFKLSVEAVAPLEAFVREGLLGGREGGGEERGIFGTFSFCFNFFFLFLFFLSFLFFLFFFSLSFFFSLKMPMIKMLTCCC